MDFENFGIDLSNNTEDFATSNWRIIKQNSRESTTSYEGLEICVCALYISSSDEVLCSAGRAYKFTEIYKNILVDYSMIRNTDTFGPVRTFMAVQLEDRKRYRHLAQVCMAAIDIMNQVNAANLGYSLKMGITTSK